MFNFVTQFETCVWLEAKDLSRIAAALPSASASCRAA